jgi:hypothetical protein
MVSFYNTYKTTWSILPMVVIDKSEEIDYYGNTKNNGVLVLCLGLHWLCFGVVFTLKKYENKNTTTE